MHPLIPLDMFRSRAFTVINLSTLVVYGALYVTFYSQALFFQGTLGYSALGAGLAGLPSGIMIALLSTAVGGFAGRFGPRRFVVMGPALMGCGVLWLSRISTGSRPWVAQLDVAASLVPPMSYLKDVLPAMLAFGLGAAVMVAPLTSLLMSSVPEEHSGLASAVNNAISRIGPQLVGALIFIAISSTFYATLERLLPASDAARSDLHALAQPLNRPTAAGTEFEAASKEASADSFSLAMRFGAALLFLGAAINAAGLRRLTERGATPPSATGGLASPGWSGWRAARTISHAHVLAPHSPLERLRHER